MKIDELLDCKVKLHDDMEGVLKFSNPNGNEGYGFYVIDEHTGFLTPYLKLEDIKEYNLK